MNLQQLRYAKAVAELGSFSAAADKCAVTQPTLSNGIAQLERDLGHKLFQRTSRRVQLTAAGAELLPALAEVLNAQAGLVAMAARLTNPERRLVRIGVSPLLGVALVDLVIDPFRRANPDYDFVFREMNLGEMLRQVGAGQLDCVFGPQVSDAPLAGGWTEVPLHDEPLVYLASALSGRSADAVALSDIAQEVFVMVPDACGLARATRAAFKARQLTLREYPGEAMSYQVLQDWAALGIGSAIVPQSKVRGAAGAPILLREGAPEKLVVSFHALWNDHHSGDGLAAPFFHYLRGVAPAILRGLG